MCSHEERFRLVCRCALRVVAPILSHSCPPVGQYYDGSFGDALFPFGFGLSYVQWGLKWAAPPRLEEVSPGKSVTLEVSVDNLGEREGDQVWACGET